MLGNLTRRFDDWFFALFRLDVSRNMQTEIAQYSHSVKSKCAIFVRMNDRLQKLKKSLSIQWGEMANRLGVSRSMIDQIRKGTRMPGPRLERRIRELEQDAGIAPKFPTHGKPTSEKFQRLEDSPGVVHEPRDTYKNTGQPDRDDIPARLDALEYKLDQILSALEAKMPEGKKSA